MFQIDLNCDLGESYGPYKMGRDDEILDYVTSANIACGFHAGDPTTMRKTVTLALEKKVAVGAHPGFQDLIGFGRRNIDVTPDEVYDIVVYQIGALQAFVKAEGGVLQHVKPHGALYNMAAKNPLLANAIARAIYMVNPELILLGLSGSELIKAGEARGLRTASEVFSDRTYQEDGTLTPRTNKNALIKDKVEAVNQVIGMVKEGKVQTTQGTNISIKAHSVCIHGDGEHAVEFARGIKIALNNAGITVGKLAEILS